MVTKAQYEILRDQMARCPVPDAGDWLAGSMDALRDGFGYNKAVQFAVHCIGTGDFHTMMERGLGFLKDAITDLEDSDAEEPTATN